ncbi:hypothetical protein N480_03755 [Pseudoalteromonas luteoviolacea S2607]|uniref:hypothetical protein n=1 Tax=Pseudoalteromonas luteoviolacea TaxID=43657 RepID=UPI0007B08E76|nr:hypothetical protein [Pseudoalteromonas luteoviolacea]KZN30070.1 hypothetical protein N480_03755 [Pseudoalteromonas luteoviolacea S2607]
MSNLSLDLLIESGLISSSGRACDISKIPEKELSRMLCHYNASRISVADSEIQDHIATDKLNALFGTGSTTSSNENILSSTLVYDSVVVDDPLVTSSNLVSRQRIEEGLKFFEWAFCLIRANYLKVIPLSYFNKPNNDIPFLVSDDAFKSSIPEEVHDFIHSNAVLNSVDIDDEGALLVLNEDAYQYRKPALKVGFKNDYWVSGVCVYKYETVRKLPDKEDGYMSLRKTWDPNIDLSKSQFSAWAYQSINQAMRSRLSNIYNESSIAEKIGHTYVTESAFESELLSMAGELEGSRGSIPARFLKANNSFINIDSPKTILELRNKFSTAFERFNYSLLCISDELSSVQPENFEKKAQKLFHKEILPQVDEIRDNVNSISSSGTKGVLGSLVGLSAAIATGSTIPLFPAIMTSVSSGLNEAFPAISKQQNLKKRPAYIWHRITR